MIRAACIVVLGLIALGCKSAPPPVPSTPAARSAASTTRAGDPIQASEQGPADADLAITFDPRISGELGWVKLPKPLSLDMSGNPGAAWIDATADHLRFTPSDPVRRALLKAMFQRAAFADTSVVIDEENLCSSELLGAVDKARPRRMLISVRGGLTSKAVTCLHALPTAQLYLAGCLFRSHQTREQCDGDAELEALVSDESLRPRIRGLAVSLSKRESAAALGKLPMLEYLALSPGRGADFPLFDALPFPQLEHLRYLEAAGENREGTALAPQAARFLGHLRTLRWHGELALPIPAPCALERFSTELLGERDMTALAACKDLKELSSDTARFERAESVAQFAALERLHLRHWKAEALAPLARLENLRSLSLPAASKATDFAFLASMVKLRSVELSQTKLQSLAPFQNLTALEELDVDFTAVQDLSPLRSLTNLVALRLHETKVSDIGVLAGLTRVRELSISNTPVTDLKPLENHPALEWVILYGSRVTDARALATLPNLKRAHIGGLRLPEDQVTKLRDRLGHQLVR